MRIWARNAFGLFCIGTFLRMKVRYTMGRYSRDDYFNITNASCLLVAEALGLVIDESKRSNAKAVHIKDSGGLYIFPEKNNWYRHSDGAKGFPADLVADTLGCSRDDALDFIANRVLHGVYLVQPETFVRKNLNRAAKSNSEFVVPPHDIKPSRVCAYLIRTRGIDKNIVFSLIEQQLIAEDNAHHNCLFFGTDEKGVIQSCAFRGTSSFVQFRGEAAGGDKTCPFAVRGTNDVLRIFESPIDALSHATFQTLLGKNWKAEHRLSLNGCENYMAAYKYLCNHPEINHVYIGLDNDKAGREAAIHLISKIQNDFPDRQLKLRIISPITKDWNEDLQHYRRLNIPLLDFLKMTAEEIDEAESEMEQQANEMQM